MKISRPVLFILAGTAATTAAWTTATTTTRHASHKLTLQRKTSALSALSRRQALLFGGSGLLTATLMTPNSPAVADVDYSKIQDLLGAPDSSSTAPTTSYSGGKRPTYLTEPTEEFKEQETKAAVFKRQQLQAKQKFNAIFQKFETDPNDENLLAKDLDDMRNMVTASGGLPLGITKDEVVKRVRRRKAQKPKYWPTQVEIAYQDLIQEILFQQNPNKDKDSDNPL